MKPTLVFLMLIATSSAASNETKANLKMTEFLGNYVPGSPLTFFHTLNVGSPPIFEMRAAWRSIFNDIIEARFGICQINSNCDVFVPLSTHIYMGTSLIQTTRILYPTLPNYDMAIQFACLVPDNGIDCRIYMEYFESIP